MRITVTIALILLLGIFECSFASQGVPGFILSSSKSPQPKKKAEGLVYQEKNIKDLVAHNLGMFETINEISDSSQNIISNLGNKNLFSFQKLNYVFLLEGASASSLTLDTRKGLKHQSDVFSICQDDNSGKCLINHFFSKKNPNSVLNNLKKFTKSQNPEAYIFSNEENLESDVSESRLISTTGRAGTVIVTDQRSDEQFRIADSLQSCVNSLFKSQFTIHLEEGILQSADNTYPTLVFESAKEDFVQYMGDLCSVVGISTLIRKDSNPSFFVFAISSLGKLEKFVSKEQSAALYQLFNIAYDEFMKNVLAEYEIDEISGQVFILNPSKTSSSKTFKLPNDFSKVDGRRLEEETTPTPGGPDEPSSKTITVIFRSLLIAFVFVIAWVCIEMFTMDIQKDSVVYAKFLAADYFRR